MNNGGGWLGLGRGSGTGDSGERDGRGLGPTEPLKSLKFQFLVINGNATRMSQRPLRTFPKLLWPGPGRSLTRMASDAI